MFEFEAEPFSVDAEGPAGDDMDPCRECGHPVRLHASRALLEEFPERNICPKSRCRCVTPKESP